MASPVIANENIGCFECWALITPNYKCKHWEYQCKTITEEIVEKGILFGTSKKQIKKIIRIISCTTCKEKCEFNDKVRNKESCTLQLIGVEHGNYSYNHHYDELKCKCENKVIYVTSSGLYYKFGFITIEHLEQKLGYKIRSQSKCTVCESTGKIKSHKFKKCDNCEGTGGQKCLTCMGCRYIHNRHCPSCTNGYFKICNSCNGYCSTIVDTKEIDCGSCRDIKLGETKPIYVDNGMNIGMNIEMPPSPSHKDSQNKLRSPDTLANSASVLRSPDRLAQFASVLRHR